MNKFYNKHYIAVRSDGAIIDAWSDGPYPEKDTANAICINDQGGYQFRLYPDGEENPPIRDMDGIPLYKWDGSQVVHRTDEEIGADRAAISVPPPSQQEQLRADVGLYRRYDGGDVMSVYEMAKMYYPRLWDKFRLKALMKAERLTAEEYESITGEPYAGNE